MNPDGEIIHAFRNWTASLPHVPALLDGEATWTRFALVKEVDGLAELLKQDDPFAEETDGPRVLALLVPRSWAFPVGLLAARAAGLAFLPLDITTPTERLAVILRAARPCGVLAFADDARATAALAASKLTAAGEVVCWQANASGTEELALTWLSQSRRLPHGAGHLIFTSGSTGIPKGVILRDGPLLRTAAEQRRHMGLSDASDATSAPCALTLNPSFDASLSDVFCGLLGPSPLVVFRPEQSRWRDLAAFLRHQGVERIHLAPALMRLITPKTLGLRTGIFGGERCDPDTAARWGAATLALQAYGPTEAAVCAMMARAGPGWTDGLLGRPLRHQRVLLSTALGLWKVEAAHEEATPDDMHAFNATYLLAYDALAHAQDEHPPVLEGEILLGGDAVAMGYLDAPAANAARFGEVEGLRVHRTGDMARWRDGLLVWTGRNDRQFKVNGRMVCPEEVEAIASEAWGGPCACLPGRRGSVLALGDRVQGTHDRDPAEVLAEVTRRLGEAMRPRVAAIVGKWPLTPHDKTDFAEVRRRLVEMELLPEKTAT